MSAVNPPAISMSAPEPTAAVRPAAPARRITWIVLVCLGVVGISLAAAAWSRSQPKNFGIVQDGQIYRSGELTTAALRRVVDRYHIRTIIDLGAYAPGSGEDQREQRTAKALGVERYVLPLEGDATGNPNYYVQALRLMNDPAKQPVLVHCSAGTQRTGCLVMLQRHIVEGKPYSDVFHEATDHRHDPGDNPHLLLMLAEWSDEIAESYRTGDSIPGLPPVPKPVPQQ